MKKSSLVRYLLAPFSMKFRKQGIIPLPGEDHHRDVLVYLS